MFSKVFCDVNSFKDLQREVALLANPAQVKVSQRFFKTGKGEYAEGDVFAGLMVPQCRVLAKKYSALSWRDIAKLLKSTLHEERLIALLMLVQQSRTKSRARYFTMARVARFYLAHTRYINNWDLVDLSAPHILGAYLAESTFRGSTSKSILTRLARSANLWERRIAIVATLALIKQGYFDETLYIAKILLHDPHDLIHKAVGWMLREVGKRDQPILEAFLQEHAKAMPRTMLRYAIEKFSPALRQQYLKNSYAAS